MHVNLYASKYTYILFVSLPLPATFDRSTCRIKIDFRSICSICALSIIDDAGLSTMSSLDSVIIAHEIIICQKTRQKSELQPQEVCEAWERMKIYWSVKCRCERISRVLKLPWEIISKLPHSYSITRRTTEKKLHKRTSKSDKILDVALKCILFRFVPGSIFVRTPHDSSTVLIKYLKLWNWGNFWCTTFPAFLPPRLEKECMRIEKKYEFMNHTNLIMKKRESRRSSVSLWWEWGMTHDEIGVQNSEKFC